MGLCPLSKLRSFPSELILVVFKFNSNLLPVLGNKHLIDKFAVPKMESELRFVRE
jgi:hypothetical protein